MIAPPEPTVIPVKLSAKHGSALPLPADALKHLEKDGTNEANKQLINKAINYKNGRKQEQKMFSYINYYNHKEKLPSHYHPLVQYLEETEVKYHNDNLFENSPIGFPTRAQ